VIPETDAATQAIFDQGHEVGEWAMRLFRDGIEVVKDAPPASKRPSRPALRR
jgi:hypothetical protein